MRTLEEFQLALLDVLQRLGEAPTSAQVEAAGRALVAGGVPEGADIEGLLLLQDLAGRREG